MFHFVFLFDIIFFDDQLALEFDLRMQLFRS